MKKIKVMQVVWRFNTGGAERMVVSFHNHFSKSEEVDIRTLCFTPSKHELWEDELSSDGRVVYIPEFWADKMPGIIKKIGNRLFRKRFRSNWFLTQVYEFQPDIVHIHLSNLASELYEVCKSLPSNIKIIYHMHSMPEAVEERFIPNIKKAFASGLYNPICVTELQKSSAEKIYGISDNAIVVRNGIDQTKFTGFLCDSESLEKQRKELAIPVDHFVVGCVGRGAPIKNYPLLAKIAGRLSHERSTTLLIIGEISSKLKETILKESESANVVFAGQRKDTELLYRIMDVFVLTSFYESSSIVTVEAQLSGVPCVISDSISDEVVISDCVSKVSVNTSVDEWVHEIKDSEKKITTINDLNRFDFNNSVQVLLDAYNNLSSN